MKISIIGGGAWGSTLAQVLIDNGHDTLIYDINEEHVKMINEHKHPFFGSALPNLEVATTDLNKVKEFSNYYVLCIPTKFMANVLTNLLPLDKKALFINVSKGIDPDTFLSVGDLVEKYIPKESLLGYVNLTGPSHAEEVIERKLTLLVAASKNIALAREVQKIFSNESYIRVYTSTDVIGTEICASAKNAIAVISGVISGINRMGENARAALIVRGLYELVSLIKDLGGKKETVYGLTGLGDLIVTATSNNSRNYRCGLRLASGARIEDIARDEKQTIEGVRSIEAFYNLGIKHGISLPIINAAYEMIFNFKDPYELVSKLLTRSLKDEN